MKFGSRWIKKNIDPQGEFVFPYNGKDLGNDPTKRPAKGFEWQGKGQPGSKKGNWHNSETKESLRPDFNHAPPIEPHWDYHGPNKEQARLYLNGTIEWK